VPKAEPSFVTRSITIAGIDRSTISISETPDRSEVRVSISQNAERVSDMQMATIRMDAAQLAALCGVQYSLDVLKKEAPPELTTAGAA
jgi:hypothetical protein